MLSCCDSIVELLELGEGVVAVEPADVLGEVAHSDVTRCSIERRPVVLGGLELDEGSSFISDIFVQSGATFNPSQKVRIITNLILFLVKWNQCVCYKNFLPLKWSCLNIIILIYNIICIETLTHKGVLPAEAAVCIEFFNRIGVWLTIVFTCDCFARGGYNPFSIFTCHLRSL